MSNKIALNLLSALIGIIGLVANILGIVTFFSDPNSSIITDLAEEVVFANISWNVRELSLIIILGIGVVFILVALYSRDESSSSIGNLFYVLYAWLVFLIYWIIVFYPFGTFQLYRQILIIWLCGLVSLSIFFSSTSFIPGCSALFISGIMLSFIMASIERNLVVDLEWNVALKSAVFTIVLGYLAPAGFFISIVLSIALPIVAIALISELFGKGEQAVRFILKKIAKLINGG